MGRKIKSDVKAGLPDGSKAFHAPTPESVRGKREKRLRKKKND